MTLLQGLVFKWGSLVGLSLPSSGASNTLPFVAGDVVFRPREFAGSITTWATVPWCATDFASYGDKSVDHLAAIHTAANFAKGIGDVCRYMGVVDGVTWRMATAAEWIELYGSDQLNKGQSVKLGSGWVIGNYHPLSGRAMGVGRDGVKIIGSGAAARVTFTDPEAREAYFLPASGYRHPTVGAIFSIGSGGFCWSATAVDAGNGYHMQFTSTTVLPQCSAGRIHGFSVRCIRE